MRRPFAGFVGGAYRSSSWKASAQRCVNLYVEEDPEKTAVLYPTPGMEAINSLFNGNEVLEMLETPSALYVWTNATDAYRIAGATRDANGTLVLSTVFLLNTVDASEYIVTAQAGDRIMFVNGQAGYWADRSGVFSFVQIVDPDFPANPQTCDAVDGYFLVHGPNSDQFFWSPPFDPSTWNALDFASAENVNDKLVRIKTLEREVYMIGQTSTEIWAVVGGDDVFDRIAGTYAPFGTPARLSPAAIGQSLLWLSRDQNGGGIVVQARGLQIARVSTHAIEQEIQAYTRLDDARAFCYQQGGHQFYVLTFPTAGKTWVYDLTTQLWHERMSTVFQVGSPDAQEDVHWQPRCHAYFAGANLVGYTRRSLGLLVPTIAELTPRMTKDPDNIIKRIRTSPHVMRGNEYMSVDAMEFVLQPGVGRNVVNSVTAPEDTRNPQALLRLSRDGGQTYGATRRASIGEQGKYRRRVKFNRMGVARDFIAELSISSDAYTPIVEAWIESD